MSVEQEVGKLWFQSKKEGPPERSFRLQKRVNEGRPHRSLVISRLVDRIEVGKGYTVNIRMKVAMEQLIEKTA